MNDYRKQNRSISSFMVLNEVTDFLIISKTVRYGNFVTVLYA